MHGTSTTIVSLYICTIITFGVVAQICCMPFRWFGDNILTKNIPHGCARFQHFFFKPCNRFKGALLFQPCKHIDDNVKVVHSLVEFACLFLDLAPFDKKKLENEHTRGP